MSYLSHRINLKIRKARRNGVHTLDINSLTKIHYHADWMLLTTIIIFIGRRSNFKINFDGIHWKKYTHGHERSNYFSYGIGLRIRLWCMLLHRGLWETYGVCTWHTFMKVRWRMDKLQIPKLRYVLPSTYWFQLYFDIFSTIHHIILNRIFLIFQVIYKYLATVQLCFI